jgi:hypothetical protein
MNLNSLKRLVPRLRFYRNYAPSFSSAGEDMILRHLIGSDKMDGFYVDVGAYHPVKHSNTYFFYIHGWRGINIDARPGTQRLFEKERPRDISLELGISNVRGVIPFYVFAEDSTMNSFSRQFLEEIGMWNHVKEVIDIPVAPLSTVLETHLPPGQIIDFMNIDVEGHGLEVVQSNDWERFRPRFLLVEDEPKATTLPFLNSVDYKTCAQNVIILNKVNEYFLIDTRWQDLIA